jgi:predicted KAP-like P-loop ATPase
LESPTHGLELSPDRPLRDVGGDGLGLVTFARHVAGLISGSVPQAGLAVGIFGDPGSGRTSALNLVRAALGGSGRFTTEQWDPWLLGDCDLQQSFAEVLGRARDDARLVVLVDDADRLPPDRLREVLRLVVASAADSGTIFVAALSRGCVEPAVLAKAVQVELDIPLPDRAALQQFFLDRIEPVIAEARESGLVHPDHWMDVCATGIDPFLQTPRDVVRLVNAIAATFPAVRGEVNPVDFIALEALRLFSPVAYESVRRRPAAFLLPSSARRTEDGSLDETLRYHERWAARVDEETLDRSRTLLMRIFPRLTDVLGARTIATLPEDSWRPLLLAACEEIFPIYFQLAVPRGAISNADLNQKLEHFGDTNQFAAALLELVRDSRPDAGTRLEAFLQRLENHIGETSDREELEGSLRALFQAADDLLRREESGRVDVDSQRHLRRIVRRGLMQVEQDQRPALLEEVLAGGGSIATTTDIVMMLGQQHGKYGGEWREGAETLVTLSQLAQIENIALTAVRDAAELGTLLGSPRMIDALSCWVTWNRGQCRTWVARAIADDEGLIAFLRPFMAAAGTPSLSARGPRVENRLDHRRLRPFLEPGSIVERVRRLAETHGGTEQERQLMKRFVLDHELLQQATSADYATDGDHAPAGETYAA